MASLLVGLLSASIPCLAYTYQYADSAGNSPLRWNTNVINISFAPSLSSPGANIKANSDVLGAARRALARWSEASGIKFVELTTGAHSISPSSMPDGINLITVSQTPENASAFGVASEITSRTRIFFNASNGTISEADITINPTLQYSTDGTPGTYDLEGTFTHEIGHLLGLDHSASIGSTMQPMQGRNGNYNLPATSSRTLTYDDRAGIRSLYGLTSRQPSISGIVTTSSGTPVFGAHVWAETLSSGRLMAGTISRPDGTYFIEGLIPDKYRVVVAYLNGVIDGGNLAPGNRLYGGINNQPPFLATESTITLPSQGSAPGILNLTVTSGQPATIPQLFGINGQLSISAVPLLPGMTYRVYVGGAGVDQIPASGVASLSPFLILDAESLKTENFGTPFPVISFNLQVAGNAHVSSYTIRFRASSGGDSAYLTGALTVDSYTNEFKTSNR
ncbi:MAG: matrixin family metalloprotease [Pyrinomonadaceae bacterium]